MKKSILTALILSFCACADTRDSPVNERFPINPETGLRVDALGPVPTLPPWPDNPSTEPKVALGRLLFSDPRLSGSGRVACSACHFPASWFQSNTPQDVPDRSYPDITPRLTRNAPSLLNIAHASTCRWDGGHCDSLEEVMMLPFAEPNMNLTPGIPRQDNHTIDVALAQHEFRRRVVEVIPGYAARFEEAFNVDISTLEAGEVWALGGKALAVLMRDATSGEAPFDRWNSGDESAMEEIQVRGLEVFMGSGGCITCHSGPFFTDFQFHNMSREEVRPDGSRADEGRFLVTGDEADRGKFLTPTLRSVVMTGPFFHDGSEADMRKLVAHITGPDGKKDPLHDPILDGLDSLSATDTEALVAFLKALTGRLPPAAIFTAPVDELPGIDEVPIGTSL